MRRKNKQITLCAPDEHCMPDVVAPRFLSLKTQVLMRGMWSGVLMAHVPQLGKKDAFWLLDTDQNLGLYVQDREWGYRAWYPHSWRDTGEPAAPPSLKTRAETPCRRRLRIRPGVAIADDEL